MQGQGEVCADFGGQMNDFDPDVIIEAARIIKENSGMDILPERPIQPPFVPDETAADIRAWERKQLDIAANFLRNDANICEAFSELPDEIILLTGRAAMSNQSDALMLEIGRAICAGMYAYALEYAEGQMV